MAKKKSSSVRYTKWGYIFLIPFFLVFIVFSLIPLISTIYNSFFENYRSGLTTIGPHFVGLDNYIKLFKEYDILKYTSNTILIWLLGFIPQIIVSITLAAWFTDLRLKLKGKGFFKTVMYMPGLIMAAAFSMLFFSIFSDAGPINDILMDLHIIKEPFRFLSNVAGTRGLIALMNFLMWFGNTTIILMAGIMSIDVSLFEAAEVDGASSFQIFRKVTIPQLKPMLVYVLITSLIGGLQMFDVPQVLTNGKGTPNNTSMTLIMFLNKHLFSYNYGMGGSLSVILFILTFSLSLLVFFTFIKKKD